MAGEPLFAQVLQEGAEQRLYAGTGELLARIHAVNPDVRRVALSATVADPDVYRAWLAPWGDIDAVQLVSGEKGAPPEVEILLPEEERVPWGGHAAVWAIPQLYRLIKNNRTTLVFTNTRFLAEYIFQELWNANEDNPPIAIHHGSLSREARRKVEGAMARGELRALVAKTKEAAMTGNFEPFKTTTQFDGTSRDPQSMG